MKGFPSSRTITLVHWWYKRLAMVLTSGGTNSWAWYWCNTGTINCLWYWYCVMVPRGHFMRSRRSVRNFILMFKTTPMPQSVCENRLHIQIMIFQSQINTVRYGIHNIAIINMGNLNHPIIHTNSPLTAATAGPQKAVHDSLPHLCVAWTRTVVAHRTASRQEVLQSVVHKEYPPQQLKNSPEHHHLLHFPPLEKELLY